MRTAWWTSCALSAPRRNPRTDPWSSALADHQIRQYLIVTVNYWAFTLTDGALRMLVVLYFHQLGYTPLEIALLFLFYEFFGIVTNLLGGWLGARLGLNRTMNVGLFLQVAALSALLVPAAYLTVPWVMAAQALSGIAKDLNKMSAKSSVKMLVPEGARGRLYRWVTILTGSKNALKGIGFFLGAVLLTVFGFRGAVAVMAMALVLVLISSLILLQQGLGKSSRKPKFRQIFSKSRAINFLSAARLFLFAARDVWFVVALPVYLATVAGWDHWRIGGFLALWIIGYGVVQSLAPALVRKRDGAPPDGRLATLWAAVLTVIPLGIYSVMVQGIYPVPGLVLGLLAFGILFALNSSLHSYLIVHYADRDGVSLDIGFYYMANAAGRLFGTVLSGWLYQTSGIEACLLVSMALIGITAVISLALPRESGDTVTDRA